LTKTEKGLITNSNGNLKIETISGHDVVNTELVAKLSKYAYKSWPYFGGQQLGFSENIINSIH
jgi:hypothetical protein